MGRLTYLVNLGGTLFEMEEAEYKNYREKLKEREDKIIKICEKRGWQSSTIKDITKIINEARSIELAIYKIESLIKNKDENKFLTMLDELKESKI